MVALSIVSAGEPLERASILRRFIELAFILQSGAYGNLFSFISIMQGLSYLSTGESVDRDNLFFSIDKNVQSNCPDRL